LLEVFSYRLLTVLVGRVVVLARAEDETGGVGGEEGEDVAGGEVVPQGEGEAGVEEVIGG
jgi:hypothetical protein